MKIDGMTFVHAFMIFGLVLICQTILWRKFRFKKQMFFLFLLFIGIPILVFLVSLMLNQSFLASSVLALSISIAYLMSFPAVQAQSPSLQIILALRRSKNGLSREDLYEQCANNRLVEDRLSDLVNDGLLISSGQTLLLSRKGSILARIFYYYRRLLKLPYGAG